MVQSKLKALKTLFEIEKKPTRRLMAMEWVVIAYILFTLLIVFFAYTKVEHPQAMIWERVRMGAITIAMWIVYQLIPCRLTRLLRMLVQFFLLSWWYPDTYELNKLFPNLDPTFASIEQHIFGCQPALLFSQKMPQIWFSELMDLGYASYYPIFVVVLFYYFFKRYQEFERTGFIILAAFFSCYVVYDVLPVTGPMYYYQAVGVDQIAKGIFPSVGDYFLTHREMLTSPGYQDGIFYQLVTAAHDAGERPTAAFPSSHVAITVLSMILAFKSKSKVLFYCLLPLSVILCFSTVYIQAHYAIDAIAGLFVGLMLYFGWDYVAKKVVD